MPLNNVIRKNSSLTSLSFHAKRPSDILCDLNTFSSFLESVQQNYHVENLRLACGIEILSATKGSNADDTIVKPLRLQFRAALYFADESGKPYDAEMIDFPFLHPLSTNNNHRITEMVLDLTDCNADQSKAMLNLVCSEITFTTLQKVFIKLDLGLFSNIDPSEMDEFSFREVSLPLLTLIRSWHGLNSLEVELQGEVLFPPSFFQEILQALKADGTPKHLLLAGFCVNRIEVMRSEERHKLTLFGRNLHDGFVKIVVDALGDDCNFQDLHLRWLGIDSPQVVENLFHALGHNSSLEDLSLHCRGGGLRVSYCSRAAALIRRNRHLKRLFFATPMVSCSEDALVEMLFALVENRVLERIEFKILFSNKSDKTVARALISVLPRITTLKHLSFPIPLICFEDDRLKDELIASMARNQCLESFNLYLSNDTVGTSHSQSIKDASRDIQHELDYLGKRNQYRVFLERDDDHVPLALWSAILGSTNSTNSHACSLVYLLLRAKSNLLIPDARRKRRRED